MSRAFRQDPDEKLDYAISYAGRMGTGDTIAVSVWTVPSGLTGSQQQMTAQTASIFLTGGTNGVDYVVLNRVTTTNGRILEDFIVIQMRSKG